MTVSTLDPDVFGVVTAIAPDCFFEARLRGKIYDSLTSAEGSQAPTFILVPACPKYGLG